MGTWGCHVNKKMGRPCSADTSMGRRVGHTPRKTGRSLLQEDRWVIHTGRLGDHNPFEDRRKSTGIRGAEVTVTR